MTRTALATVVVRIAVVCMLLTMTTRPANAQSPFCRQVNYPGSAYTLAHGINSRGDIVGEYGDALGQHGFLLSGGQYSAIDGPSGPDPTWTIAYGINDAGQIVGAYSGQRVCNCVDDLESHGFVLTGGAMSTFDIGRSRTIPRDINNSGQIAGYYGDYDGDIEDAPRGFLLDQGGLTRIDAPGGRPHGRTTTQPMGINDAGLIVGNSTDDGQSPAFMFTWLSGQMTHLPNPPGAWVANVGGIDKGGTVVGSYFGSDYAIISSFVRDTKRFSDFNCPGVESTVLESLNDKGALVGTYRSGDTMSGFYTPPITFIDPVPDLLTEQVLTTTSEKLGTKGRQVQGAAADGTAIVVLRIPAANVGDQVTVTLLKSDNVQDVATSSDTNGGLGTPNHTCCQFSVSVTAEFTSNGPMAFATYRVPDDFPRPGGGDDALKFRDVYFRFQAPGGGDTKVPLRLIRPPVALIHGLWDNSGAWNAFRPLVTGRDTSDQRFKIVRFGFDDAIGTQISGSNPPYTAKQLGSALANSLGFSYNADRVLVKMEQAIEDFKAGANPEKISVAAIQFDIVAHSMGGDIVRTMPRSTGYLQRKSFGQGIVHKLITIDTPHTGSPVATRLLSTQEDNSCLRDVLAKEGYLAFRAVTLGGRSVPGAVGDLVHAPLSDALQSIATAGPKGIFTSMFAGVLLDFTSLDPRLSRAGAIRLWCWGTPLAQALKSTTWPLVFTDDGSHRNDGIVSHASQRNGSSNVATTEGILHSVGMRELGFAGFAALDPDNIAVSVINVLNRPRGNTTYYSVLNP